MFYLDTVRPGRCPKINGRMDECPPPESQTNGCVIDSDCKDSNDKCCSDGCNLMCMNAITRGQSLEKGKTWK